MTASGHTVPPRLRNPYAPDPDTAPGRARRRWLLVGVVVYCLLFGMAFALLAPALIVMFAVPPLLLAALAIWALPDARRAPTRLLELLFYGFFITLIAWPNYLALALPGLPWITFIRITGVPLVFVLLVCVSLSPDFRVRLARSLNGVPALWKLLSAFVAIQIISIAFSHSLGESLDKLLVDQMAWTTVFFVSCYLFQKPGRVYLWASVLWILAIYVSLIAVVEYRRGQVPWAGHIPSFLKIDDPMILRILQGQSRAFTGIYRAQSTFGTSLGLSEYIALTIPFVMQFLSSSFHLVVRLCAAVSIPLLFYIVLLTNSRLGVVGCFLAFFLYLLAWAVQSWRNRPSSLLGPAITLAYPVIFAAGVAATFFVGRIRATVWGSGEQTASTMSRVTQYHQGIPMVLTHPWGHGIGMGAETLGYYSPAGILTIDTYYLRVALEYGIIGFLIYYGMILFAIYTSARHAYVSRGRGEYNMFIPLTIALVNFFVIKSVFAQEDNHPLIFMMMGIIVALAARFRMERKAAASPA